MVVSLTTAKFKPLIFSDCVVPLVYVIQLWVKLHRKHHVQQLLCCCVMCEQAIG
jgi:hypothetical protein